MTDQIKTLAAHLGISDKHLTKLADKYEDKLESVLAKWWNESKETPRFMARQAGTQPRTKDGQYVETAALAIDDAEVVPADYQNVISIEAHKRWTVYENTERAEEVAKRELRAVTQALREVALVAARQGIDTGPLLADVRAQIATHGGSIEKRAA